MSLEKPKQPTSDQAVKHLFSNISGKYDLLNRVLSFGTDQRWRRKGVALLPHGPDIKILDMASGTLDLAIDYLQAGPGSVYAIDIALPMLLTGRNKISPLLDHRLHLTCGDCMKLPYPDHFFDGAMCAWGVRNFSDCEENLKELHRVLKPAGKLLVIEFFKPSRPFSKLFYKTYGRYVIPAIGKWISGDPQAYQYLQDSIQSFCTRKEYEELLNQYHFTHLKSEELTGGISTLLFFEKYNYTP